MKKNRITILIVTIIIIYLCVFLLIYSKEDNLDYDGLEINIILQTYKETMSDTKGFKFKAICDEKNKVTILVSKGNILSDGNLEKTNDNYSYIAECNQNIYWYPNDVDNNISFDEIISIEVQLNSDNNQKKIIELKVNDDYEYYLYKLID